jgi:YVTN family beta-propeller protein
VNRLVLVFALAVAPVFADDRDKLTVGLQKDGSILTPTNQLLKPAGTQVLFPGRPVDLVLIDSGKTLVAKDMKSLEFIDVATGKVTQTLAIPAAKKGEKAAGFSAVGLVAVGDRLLVSDSQSAVRAAKKGADGKYAWDGDGFALNAPAAKGAAYPTGLAVDGDALWVCSSRGNELQRIDTKTSKVTAVVPVGVCPYQPLVVGKKVYVSNWGGDRPDDPKAITTSGTPVRTDPRTSVANHGSVSVVEKVGGTWKSTKSIPVGGHPCGLTASKDGSLLYVANANSDTVSVIPTGTDTVWETIDCKPEKKLPFGSGSDAVALSPDGKTLYVANGTNNGVAVVALGTGSGGLNNIGQVIPSKVVGLIPTGWYPGAITVSADGKTLFVANVKGHGSLNDARREKEKGKNSHDHLGSVSIIPVPTADELKKHTETVNANNRLAYSLAGLEKPRAGVKAVPVPERHGEPSVIEHVVYVIKENRTYDQVFGDMKEGNGDPNLCLFGEEVTPNLHKLAREFVLLDNFYCSGVLSADGHSWVNEAYTTDYLEKQFGQFTRSYPYEGSDPLAFPTSGFLWDNALLHKKTFYNFGEHCKTTFTPKSPKWADLYADYVNGTSRVKVTVEPNLPSLKPYTHPNYPGFPINVPDVWRANVFLEQFRTWEQNGTMPNLVYVFLPADHTEGTRPDSPTPRAMNADGDLALGQIVEAISKSKFWPKTAILVTMDDPQNGFDHVDGHRTVGLAVSPYTKRKSVDSTCYNQTGMVKTIELMLGLPPMTQLDLMATPMRNCFTDKPDATPYTAEKNRIRLDEMNPPMNKLDGKALHWAKKSLELDFSKEDRIEEGTLNRILWFSVKGDAPYPGDR